MIFTSCSSRRPQAAVAKLKMCTACKNITSVTIGTVEVTRLYNTIVYVKCRVNFKVSANLNHCKVITRVGILTFPLVGVSRRVVVSRDNQFRHEYLNKIKNKKNRSAGGSSTWHKLYVIIRSGNIV